VPLALHNDALQRAVANIATVLIGALRTSPAQLRLRDRGHAQGDPRRAISDSKFEPGLKVNAWQFPVCRRCLRSILPSLAAILR
jgi:hypothetical protein